MSRLILTLEQATALYEQGLAYFEGTYGLMTRTAGYDYNDTTQRYERVIDGLRHNHQCGAAWNGRRFVRCVCAHCARYPEQVATVRVYEGAL